MKIAIIILLAIFTLIFAMLLLPVRIIVDYKKNEEKNNTSLILKYGFLKFDISEGKKNRKKPEKEKKHTSFKEKRDKLSEYIKVFEDTKDDAAKILDYAAERAVVIEKAYTDIEFGFEDAMHTGIFTGILNGFVYGVLGFIHQHSTLRDMHVNIQPFFDDPCFRIEAGCIVRIKNVHIIIVAINILKILRKISKKERSKK